MAIAMPPRRVNLNALETRLRANFLPHLAIDKARREQARRRIDHQRDARRPAVKGAAGGIARSAAQVQGRRNTVTLAQRALARSRDLALLAAILRRSLPPLEVEV